MRIAVAAALFAITWLVWSGNYQPMVVGLGTLSCALVTVIALRTGFFSADVYALHLWQRLPQFWAWLLKEIIKANFIVARTVLSPRLPISPNIVTIDARSLPAVGQATFANSITLTPGTLTVDLNLGQIEVHCLTREAAADLQGGEMLRRMQRLIGD